MKLLVIGSFSTGISGRVQLGSSSLFDRVGSVSEDVKGGFCGAQDPI